MTPKLHRMAAAILLVTIANLPASEAPMANPNAATPSYNAAEQSADALIAKMEKECLFEDEKPTVKRKSGFKQAIALDGKGNHWAFVISGEKLACIKASMCGTGGCQLKVISNVSGEPKLILDQQARGWKVVRTSGKAPFLQLDVHGSSCGKSGSSACFENIDLKDGTVLKAK